ncbi:MAG TPA: DUF4149 domain-containing protein [Ideonella sp.]|nr:DUF4149 domain-containing protein [Ideonella sp.]
MPAWADAARRLIPGLWAGVLWCIALIATPAPFATLAAHDAGRVVSRIFAQEAYLSVGLAVVVLLLERRAAAAAGGSRMSTNMLLALGALFCTIAGYFALQPMMEAARAGQGALSFGQLHAISFGLFGAKMLIVLALAIRAVRGEQPAPPTQAVQS